MGNRRQLIESCQCNVAPVGRTLASRHYLSRSLARSSSHLLWLPLSARPSINHWSTRRAQQSSAEPSRASKQWADWRLASGQIALSLQWPASPGVLPFAWLVGRLCPFARPQRIASSIGRLHLQLHCRQHSQRWRRKPSSLSHWRQVGQWLVVVVVVTLLACLLAC